MSKKRKNAGEGYGYMFSGAFAKKSDAVKKEKTRKGSFIKPVMLKSGMRYAVMTPRTNPIKRKKKPEKNPHELLVMAANPHENPALREIVVPPNSTITIRTNPEPRPNWMGAAKASADAKFNRRQDEAYDRQQRARRKATRDSEDEADRYYANLRKRSRASSPKEGRTRRKLAGLFHELYGRDNPVCGAMIGGERCTRDRGHCGPHLPQGATMRPQSRHHCKPRERNNPSAAAIREDFAGAPADRVAVRQEPHMPTGDYAQLGHVLALYVKPARGGQVQQINFGKSRPIAVSDESARQIWFVGGDQDVTPALGAFGRQQRSDGLYQLGECRRIDYKQRKEHVPNPASDEWRHEFGEDSGVRPVLLFDARSKRLLLEGGEYRIQSEGIIN